MSGWKEEEQHFISPAKRVSQRDVLLWDWFYDVTVAVGAARAGEVSGLSENGTDVPGSQVAFEMEKYSGFLAL